MTRRTRLAAFTALVLVVVLAVAGVALRQAALQRAQAQAPPSVPVAADGEIDGPRLVFRHTGLDSGYGHLASVALDDPDGARTISDVACDRVDTRADLTSCLRVERGVVTRYALVELDADLAETATVPLPGIPSRTRLSPDGSLVATTTFVTGHSYLQTGFSTATEIRSTTDPDGPGGAADVGNLERFRLVVDGQEVSPADRNVWGVTFVDDRVFYATVATGGVTHLVEGDLATRTLTALRTNAECPSLSPDGTRLAYKVDDAADGTHWSFAVLDLATGEERVLRGETRGVDDQAAWLDDDTLLYGVPRTDEPGVTDVWALDTADDAAPRLLVEQAWSPSVVRPPTSSTAADRAVGAGPTGGTP
ncbi:TolB family protein [Nocardioides alkalitolerans]|uniref:TolB family protein n=1 Tax=Nocardioides alkalitolerans TaxID=281714 RepID=UPI00041A80AA|nr:PD40 domain-containing protein [Nocardioides alkalitolerans]